MRASQILALAATFPREVTIIKFAPECFIDLCNIVQKLNLVEIVSLRCPSLRGCTYYLRIGDSYGTYNRTFGYDTLPYSSEFQHYVYTPILKIIHTKRKSYVEEVQLTEGVL